MKSGKFRRIFALWLMILPALFLRGEGRMVSNYGIASGLSNGYVMSITQDAGGTIWVATEEGLNRFDGNRFRSYTKDNSGLSGNELNCLAQLPSDPDHLWIGTQRDGVCVYDRRTGEISHLGYDIIRSANVTSIVPALDGDGLWITHYYQGVQYYNPSTGETRVYNEENINGMPAELWTVAEGNDGLLYVGTNHDGLCVIDTAAHSMELFSNHGNKASFPSNSVYSLCFDTSGNLWVGTGHGAVLLNPRTRVITPFVHSENDSNSIAPGRIRDIKQMSNGEIWFASTQGGVSVISPGNFYHNNLRNAKFLRIKVEGVPQGLSSNYARCLFQDSFGNVWVGNYRSGVDVISHLPPIFSRIDYIDKNSRNVTYKAVWSCVTDPVDGTLWIGGENEIVSVRGGNVYTTQLPRSEDGSHTYVRALAMDYKRTLWIGTSDNGVLMYQPEFKRFTTVKGARDDIRMIFEDVDGTMRIGSDVGAFIYRDGTLIADSAVNIRLIDKVINSMLRDRQGNLWVGTFGKGITVLDKDYRVIHSYTIDEGFPSNAINAMRIDSRGRIWVATRGGLVLFADTRQPDDFKIIENVERPGISHISSVEEDTDGSVWVSSSRGIARINPNTLKASIYDGMEMMPLHSFAENGSTVDDSGRIYFASANGVFSLMPHDVDATLTPQPIKITNFTVYKGGGSRDNELNIPINSDFLELPHYLNTFRIKFSVMDHAMAQRADLSYNMLGLDDVWIETFGNNDAMYRDLPPGEYKFQVRQRLKGHDWEQPVTVLTLRISPPYLPNMVGESYLRHFNHCFIFCYGFVLST